MALKSEPSSSTAGDATLVNGCVVDGDGDGVIDTVCSPAKSEPNSDTMSAVNQASGSTMSIEEFAAGLEEYLGAEGTRETVSCEKNLCRVIDYLIDSLTQTPDMIFHCQRNYGCCFYLLSEVIRDSAPTGGDDVMKLLSSPTHLTKFFAKITARFLKGDLKFQSLKATKWIEILEVRREEFWVYIVEIINVYIYRIIIRERICLLYPVDHFVEL